MCTITQLNRVYRIITNTKASFVDALASGAP